jgi:alpha-1,3-rhamnosyl/mannosyltransferase
VTERAVRIVIDARYINDHFPGIGRYVYNLIRALAELGAQHELIALHNPGLPNTRHDLTVLSGLAVQLVATHYRPFSLAEQTELPRLVRELRADMFHAPYYVRPYFRLPCPTIVTLYDAIPRLFPREVSARARGRVDPHNPMAKPRSSHHIGL